MSKLESVLGTRDTALAAFILHKMKDNKQLTADFRNELYAAAGEFRDTEAARRFLQSFPQAVK